MDLWCVKLILIVFQGGFFSKEFSLKPDSEFTIQYEISWFKRISEIEKYNKVKNKKCGVKNSRTYPLYNTLNSSHLSISKHKSSNILHKSDSL